MTFEPAGDDEYELAATRPRPRRHRSFWLRFWWSLTGRTSPERRRAAVLDLIAEHGPLRARDVAARLHCGLVNAVNDLFLMEKQGAVIGELGAHMDGTPPVTFYRLPYEWERKPQDGT